MLPTRIAVVGTGYVGLTVGACLASLGHSVVCADLDPTKVERLRRGVVDIAESDLSELVSEQLSARRLSFVESAADAVTADTYCEPASVVFLCVPTPMGVDGAAELRMVKAVLEEVRNLLAPGTVIVNKSTVPVGTAAYTEDLIAREDVTVASNPEFLREGTAVKDFLHPDRIVVGANSAKTAEQVAALYVPLGAPTILTDARSAELTKYAANTFLAMKLSYVNAMAELCERVGADIRDVTKGIGYDRRIGDTFLSPGPGWGGSCLPKDTHALLQIADAADFEFSLLRATIDTNTLQQQRIVNKVRAVVTGHRTESLTQARIGLLGLTFKAGTNDLRDSPSVAIAALLRQSGAEVVAYDPAVSNQLDIGRETSPEVTGIHIAADALTVAKDAEALIVLTAWPQFRTLDWTSVAAAMNNPCVIDTRNLLDPAALEHAGLVVHGIGRQVNDMP